MTRNVFAPNTLRGVTYGQYVRFRDDPRNDQLWMTFDDGVLELMSSEFRQGFGSDRIGLIVRAVAAVFKVPLQGARSTTFRKGRIGTRQGQGKEPDQSFYFANAPAIRNHDSINLEIDPPPDLWIEVDNSGSSRGRLPLYAALGVPEAWRYRARRGMLWFGRRVGDGYEEIDQSLSLPMLTPAIVLDLLSKAVAAPDEGTWDEAMRDWLRRVLKPAHEAGG